MRKNSDLIFEIKIFTFKKIRTTIAQDKKVYKKKVNQQQPRTTTHIQQEFINLHEIKSE